MEMVMDIQMETATMVMDTTMETATVTIMAMEMAMDITTETETVRTIKYVPFFHKWVIIMYTVNKIKSNILH